MKVKQIALWVIVWELLTLVFAWINLRAPRLDQLDGTPPPSDRQIVAMTHVYSFAFLAATIIFILIFIRVWKGSNRRR
jgi:hypothetical protein